MSATGVAGDKLSEVLAGLKPEVVYFTDAGPGRGAVMIIELDSAAQVPHVTEPLPPGRRPRLRTGLAHGL